MNKRQIVLFTLILISITVNSQITKGNWLIGGSVSFSSTQEHSDAIDIKKNSISTLFSGNGGYFIANNFVVGAKINYLYLFEKYSPSSDSSSIQYNGYYLEAGPFIRYYYLNNNKIINIFSEINYLYGYSSQNSVLGFKSYNNYYHSQRFSSLMGCSIFFNENIAIEFTLGYTFYNYNNVNYNSKKYSNSIIPGIGFQCHLSK